MDKDWSKMTVAQLKEKLQEYGLETSGNKADLVKRLQEHSANEEDSLFTPDVKTEAADTPTDEETAADTKNTTTDTSNTIEEHTEVTEEKPSMFDDEEINTARDDVSDTTETKVQDEAMDTLEDTDPDVKPEPALLDLNKLSVEELQAELLRRTASEASKSKETVKTPTKPKVKTPQKTTPKKVNWVTIMDSQNDDKLFKELKKLDMMAGFRRRSREISALQAKHRVVLFSLTPQELSDPVIMDIIRKCSTTDYKIRVQPNGEILGFLQLMFRRESEAIDAIPVLSEFKADIQVFHSKNTKDGHISWREQANIIGAADLDEKSVFLPSLQNTVTEETLFDLFPNAYRICLIQGDKRNHAYVTFNSVEERTDVINTLNDQGPTKEDIKYCGMLTFSRMTKLQGLDREAALAEIREAREAKKQEQSARNPQQDKSSANRPTSRSGKGRPGQSTPGRPQQGRPQQGGPQQGGRPGNMSGPVSATKRRGRPQRPRNPVYRPVQYNRPNPQAAILQQTAAILSGLQQLPIPNQQMPPPRSRQRGPKKRPYSSGGGAGGSADSSPNKMRRASGGSYDTSPANRGRGNQTQNRNRNWDRNQNQRDDSRTGDDRRDSSNSRRGGRPQPQRQNLQRDSVQTAPRESTHRQYERQRQENVHRSPHIQENVHRSPHSSQRNGGSHHVSSQQQSASRYDYPSSADAYPSVSASYQPVSSRSRNNSIGTDRTAYMEGYDVPDALYSTRPMISEYPTQTSQHRDDYSTQSGQQRDKIAAAMDTLTKLTRLRNTTGGIHDYGHSSSMTGHSDYRGSY